MSQYPHEWKPSTLGHGETQCIYCLATNREIAVIGDLNHCKVRQQKADAIAPTGNPFMTIKADDHGIHEVLSLMTPDTHKFAIDLGYKAEQSFIDALEALQISGWVRLIDVAPVASSPGRLFRVFFCTKTAVNWYETNKHFYEVRGLKI